jgi:hypothetical protein
VRRFTGVRSLKRLFYTRRKMGRPYNREDFHNNPNQYDCLLKKYLSQIDILMNRLLKPIFLRCFKDGRPFEFRLRAKTIADITDDKMGSVPCNFGDSTADPVIYGVDKTFKETTA